MQEEAARVRVSPGLYRCNVEKRKETLMFKRVSLLVFAFALFATSASAQQDPFVGTWKHNIAKSKYNPGPPPVNANMHEIEAVPNGIRVVTRGVNAQGQPTGSQWTAYYDGKDNPMKDLSGAIDTIAIRKTGPRSFEAVSKKAGKVVRTSEWTVSADGRTLSRPSKGTNAQGVAFDDFLVYEKQ